MLGGCVRDGQGVAAREKAAFPLRCLLGATEGKRGYAVQADGAAMRGT